MKNKFTEWSGAPHTHEKHTYVADTYKHTHVTHTYTHAGLFLITAKNITVL